MAIRGAANVYLVLAGNFFAVNHSSAYLWLNYPPKAHYRISEADLDNYRTIHATESWGYAYKPAAAD
jgi:hypothetical protein